MAIDRLVERMEQILSHMWEFLLLPSHSLRMTRIRLAADRAEYEMAQNLEQELAAMRQAVDTALAMEDEVARANTAGEAARQAAQDVLRSRGVRLSQTVKAGRQEERLEEEPKVRSHMNESNAEVRAVTSLVSLVLIGLVLSVMLFVAGVVAFGRLVARVDSWLLRISLIAPVGIMAAALVTHSAGLGTVAVLVEIGVLLVAHLWNAGLLEQVSLPDFGMPEFGSFKW